MPAPIHQINQLFSTVNLSAINEAFRQTYGYTFTNSGESIMLNNKKEVKKFHKAYDTLKLERHVVNEFDRIEAMSGYLAMKHTQALTKLLHRSSSTCKSLARIVKNQRSYLKKGICFNNGEPILKKEKHLLLAIRNINGHNLSAMVEYSGCLNKDALETVNANLRDRIRDLRYNLKNDQGFDGVTRHQAGYWHKRFKNINRERATSEKIPKDNKKYIGVEIEFYTDSYDESDLIDKIVEHKLERIVCLGEDGSIKPPGSSGGDSCECCSCEEEHCDFNSCSCDCSTKYNSFELKVLTTEETYARDISRVSKLLDDVGAEVNRSCGLHVHFDVRKRDAENVYKRLYRAQPLLFKLVPQSRRENSYCEPSKIDYDDNREQRYKAINNASVNKHSTIEVRLHSGTTDARKITRWVDLLLTIINLEQIDLRISIVTLEQLETLFRDNGLYSSDSLNKTMRLMTYLTERYGLFNKNTKTKLVAPVVYEQRQYEEAA